jgi:hypothetical protein
MLKNNQTSLSHATQETTLLVNPHPKKESPLPITHVKKNPLESAGIISSSIPHPKKSPFKKIKK